MLSGGNPLGEASDNFLTPCGDLLSQATKHTNAQTSPTEMRKESIEASAISDWRDLEITYSDAIVANAMPREVLFRRLKLFLKTRKEKKKKKKRKERKRKEKKRKEKKRKRKEKEKKRKKKRKEKKSECNK